MCLYIQKKCVTHKVNTFDVIQQRSLNSKFMHYSIADSSKSNGINQLPNTILPSPPSLVSINPFYQSNTYQLLLYFNQTFYFKYCIQSVPHLPEPTPEEEFPDNPKTRLFNQNVLWNFEDMRMLLGTDLPIFGGCTDPCLSLRLR